MTAIVPLVEMSPRINQLTINVQAVPVIRHETVLIMLLDLVSLIILTHTSKINSYAIYIGN